jgi:hypothetical protein
MCVSCAARPATLQTAGTVLLAVMPRFGCPFCWPILAGALSLFGIHLQALNAICITFAAIAFVTACALAVFRHEPAYLVLATNAAVLLAFRLELLSAVIAYAAAAMLLAAFLGNTLFKRRKSTIARKNSSPATAEDASRTREKT